MLITGGRDFDNVDLLHQTLDHLHCRTPFTRLVHGAAKGANRLAGQWAHTNNVEETARQIGDCMEVALGESTTS